MSSFQTPIRRPGGDSAPSIPTLASPFRTPVRRAIDNSSVISSPEQQRLPHDQAGSVKDSSSFASRGKWFNPETQQVLNDRATHLNERQSTMRLRWNIASLIVLVWCSHTGIYRQVKVVGLSVGVPLSVWSMLEWLWIALFVFNVGEAAWCLLQPKRQYTDIAMTPNQRMRIGLDSRAASTANCAPSHAPRMTPAKPSAVKQTPGYGGVTDIETRRNTPVKNIISPASNVNSSTTPRFLRSPISFAPTCTTKSDHSASSDFLTLTQVLKKIPGVSSITDNKIPATPTYFRSGESVGFPSPLISGGLGDPNLSTPRLPVGRLGVGDLTANTPIQRHLRGQPTIGLYQTATPVSRASGIEGSKGSSKDRGVGDIEYLEPHEVLEKFGVEREIFEWIENMHLWFVRHLLRPLCKQIDELDSLFEQHGLGHLSCKRAILDAAALEQAKARQAAAAAPTTFGTFGAGFSMKSGASSSLAPNTQGAPQDLADLSLRYGDLPQTKERMALEKYLLVPGYTCRDYIIQRVRALSQSGALPAYMFDGGGSYTPSSDGTGVASEKQWSPSLHPTDAQLLFHLFCTFMDQTLPPVQNSRHPFTDRYVLQPDRKPDNNLPIQIIQVVRKRPHFCLIVKGSFYDVTANRNNLFITLILFVLEIQRECAGYLGLTNLGGKQVNLMSVIGK
ncbi:hypothetical protein EV175_002967 [Coemansia sp. RSA 1933]|nr:hypothetical protein EV175_002967 [Coemansia sp. RSA 1933]